MRLIRRRITLKRVGNLYEKIYDIDNIKEAIFNASKRKRKYRYVQKVLRDVDGYAEKIHLMLKHNRFKPSKPIIKTIQDTSSGKVRTIHKPNFYPDQIVHWALMQQIQPIIMKGMYRYSCGSIPGRGPDYGLKVLRKWMDKDRKGTKYCLKMDISKFYPSIDSEILKTKFRRKIKDKKCLALIGAIIDSVDGQPIGYYTSQWFANFFLEELDHLIKQKWGIKYYIRYVDDLVLLGSNKRTLHKVRKLVEDYLNSIKLKLKGNWQVFRVDKRDIDFLGARSYRNHTTLRRRNALRIRRRAAKIQKKGYLNRKDASAIVSYWGHIKKTNSYRYYHNYIKPKVRIKDCRRVVSINARLKAKDVNAKEFVLRR